MAFVDRLGTAMPHSSVGLCSEFHCVTANLAPAARCKGALHRGLPQSSLSVNESTVRPVALFIHSLDGSLVYCPYCLQGLLPKWRPSRLRTLTSQSTSAIARSQPSSPPRSLPRRPLAAILKRKRSPLSQRPRYRPTILPRALHWVYRSG